MDKTFLTTSCSLFREKFGSDPTAGAAAPGRVELLGNHTDYNGGFILASAVDRRVWMAGKRLPEPKIQLVSETFDEKVSLAITDLKPRGHWSDYVAGVVKELLDAGVRVEGFQAVLAGDLPAGSGLSSSAGLEMATARLIQSLYPYEMPPMELAKLGQRAENDFVGMPCGLMDQFCTVFGREKCFLFLDCRSLEHQALPLGEKAPEIVVCNSMVQHALVDGEYKARREQCMAAAAFFNDRLDHLVELLRDVSVSELEAHATDLDETTAKRARHIVNDNQRVLDAVESLRAGDVSGMAARMQASHNSSRDLFENSCPELDLLVSLAADAPGYLGAKLSGGGFGGCTVNLVESGRGREFADFIGPKFKQRTGNKPQIHLCRPGPGAQTWTL